MSASGRVLVAGIGNVFFGDDGFGVEVVNRIDPRQLPPGVDIADYGVRGVHLTHDLLTGGYHTLVLVDAMQPGPRPGTVRVVEVEHCPDSASDPVPSLDLEAVLGLLRTIGADVPRVVIVGCTPAVLDGRMGLSEPVESAVLAGATLALDVARAAVAAGPCGGRNEAVADV